MALWDALYRGQVTVYLLLFMLTFPVSVLLHFAFQETGLETTDDPKVWWRGFKKALREQWRWTGTLVFGAVYALVLLPYLGGSMWEGMPPLDWVRLGAWTVSAPLMVWYFLMTTDSAGGAAAFAVWWARVVRLKPPYDLDSLGKVTPLKQRYLKWGSLFVGAMLVIPSPAVLLLPPVVGMLELGAAVGAGVALRNLRAKTSRSHTNIEEYHSLEFGEVEWRSRLLSPRSWEE